MKHRTRLTSFPSYAEATALVRGIMSVKEYGEKRVGLGLPSNPDKHYRDSGWSCWGDFLGRDIYEANLNRFMPYQQAKEIMLRLKVRNTHHYARVRKEHTSLPIDPSSSYRKEWGGWRAFLGKTAKTNNRVFLSYDKAKAIVIAHRVKGRKQFYAIVHLMRRMHIPTHPDLYYGQWRGWDDFLRPVVAKKKPRRVVFRTTESGQHMAL